MIIRRTLWQNGRQAVSRANLFNTTHRSLSTRSPDINEIGAALQWSEQEVNSIAAFINSQAGSNAPASQPRTAAAAQVDPVAENFWAFKKQQATYRKLGSQLTPYYQPHALVNNPPPPSDITLELLLASETHFGHSTSLWNPANARYITGIRQGIHIISLESTAAHLRRACRVVTEVAHQGGLILFVGTRKGQNRCVVKAAELSGGCHLFEKWTPGSITNAQQILGRCQMKVVDEFDNEVKGFEDQLLDRGSLRPDLVVCLNPLENKVLLHECSTNQIPSIGIIDTDANPTWVTYPIPANDDSLRSVQLICGVLGRAGEEGQRMRLEGAKKDEITFLPPIGLQLPGEGKSQNDGGNEATMADILGIARKDD